jgi:hypothetical protein
MNSRAPQGRPPCISSDNGVYSIPNLSAGTYPAADRAAGRHHRLRPAVVPEPHQPRHSHPGHHHRRPGPHRHRCVARGHRDDAAAHHVHPDDRRHPAGRASADRASGCLGPDARLADLPVAAVGSPDLGCDPIDVSSGRTGCGHPPERVRHRIEDGLRFVDRRQRTHRAGDRRNPDRRPSDDHGNGAAWQHPDRGRRRMGAESGRSGRPVVSGRQEDRRCDRIRVRRGPG